MGVVTGVATLLITGEARLAPCDSTPLSLVAVRACNKGRAFVEGRPLLFQPIGVTIVLPTIFLAWRSEELVEVVVTTVARVLVVDIVVGENMGGVSFSTFPDRLPSSSPVVILVPTTVPESLSL